MAVLVGIDEAGYGPILGPLVVSSAAFSVPRDLLSADLWQILTKSVSDKATTLRGRLLITDSKKAKTKSAGIKHLQRTVLSCLNSLGHAPTALNDLLTLLCPESIDRLDSYPWYREIADHRLSPDKADIAIASSVLTDDLAANDMNLLELKSCCLDVAHYNKLVNDVKNKANVLFSATSQLIKNAWDQFADDELQIIVDRQGGRVHYRKNLQRMFADMELQILKETPAISSYQLRTERKSMRLHFTIGADQRFLPVSLASMASKYLRELLIANINRYFKSLHSDLKPTAGYWKDGTRFIKDIEKNIPNRQFDNNQLIRCR